MTNEKRQLPGISARQPIAFHALLLSTLAVAACDFLPPVRVSVANGVTETSESGGSVEIIVQPKERPQRALEIFAESENVQEGTVAGSLHFDSSNWQTPQVLRVTGVDDERADGDTAYSIRVYARDADTQSTRRWLLQRIELINRDDDTIRFQPIADLEGGDVFVTAAAASADGSVVVGQSQSATGLQPFRWRSGRTIAIGAAGESALAVSEDGTQIVGETDDARYESGRAAAAFFVDRPSAELADVPEPGPGAGLLLWFVSATAVLNDGTAYGTCHQYGAYGDPIGCRQREDGELELMGGSFVFAADELRHYAGTQEAERHAPYSSRAFLDGHVIPFPSELACPANVACTAEVRALSEDAALVVGSATVPLPHAALGGALHDRAFAYAAGTMALLPDLEGGELASAAYGVSANGRTIVGFGYDERGQQAVVWLDRQPRALFDVLLELDAELPPGWSLRELRSVSRDGRVMVGNGINPQGDPQAFLVTLPLPLEG